MVKKVGHPRRPGRPKKAAGSRSGVSNQKVVTDSPRKVALINKNGTIFYIFTPNKDKSDAELAEIRERFDKRYQKPVVGQFER